MGRSIQDPVVAPPVTGRHGAASRPDLPRSDARDATRARHAGEIRSQGFTIVEGVLAPDEVVAARGALDSVFAREAALAPRRGWLTGAHRVTYMLPQKHPLFRSFCVRDDLLALMRDVLGDGCVLGSLNGLTMQPGGIAQALHIDQAESVPGTVLTVNAIHVLDDFSAANGCTRLVPRSQQRIWTGDAEQIAAAEAETIALEAPAGSVIAYDGAAWHAGSANRTDRPRRAVHAFFVRQWVRPHWDFPASVSHAVARDLTSEERAVLGFGAGPRRWDRCADRSYLAGSPRPLEWLRDVLRRRLLGR